MIDYLLCIKARFMHHVYRVVTNRAMRGCKFSRMLVLYQWDRRAPLNIPKEDNNVDA